MTAPRVFLLEITGPDYRPTDWALAVLDPDTLAVIDRRRTAYERSRAEDRQFHEAYYFDDRGVDFLANADEDDGEDETPDTDLAAMARSELAAATVDVDDGLVAVDQTAYEALAEHPTARVECVQMIIQEDGVRWMAYPKHQDDEIRTARIPWSALGMEVIRVEE